jgi:hypothetical protein
MRMASSSVKLTIPSPCAQPWLAMIPDQQGRFCTHCQKTVVNFSVMTDAQVLTHLSTSGASGCGRLRADQLNRVLTPPTAGKPGRWQWLSVLLSGWLSSQAVQAQSIEEPNKIATVITPAAEPATTSPGALVTQLASLTLEGRIVEAGSGRPITGANVLIDNTTYGVNVDTTGQFRLIVPQPPADKTIRLIARAIGYLPQTLTAHSATAGQPLVFALTKDSAALNEVVYTGGYVAQKQTLWRRIRNWFVPSVKPRR